jgi:hypothetical protein
MKLKIFACFHTYYDIPSYYFDYTRMMYDQFNISLMSQYPCLGETCLKRTRCTSFFATVSSCYCVSKYRYIIKYIILALIT